MTKSELSPIINIIVPFYNTENTLTNCIEHLVKQTYKQIEILLINDGSTDNSTAIAKQWADKVPFINLLNQEHLGAGAARNLGIEHAKGKYIFFADADDTLEENASQIMVEHLEKTQADLLIFGYRQFKNQQKKTFSFPYSTLKATEAQRDYFHAKNEQRIKGSVWNKCFCLDIIKRYNLTYPEIARNEEEIFLMRYLDIIENIVFIEDILYHFYPISLSSAFTKLPDNYAELVVEFKNACLKYSDRWNRSNAEDLNAISREYYGKMILALKLCLNPKKKDKQLFYQYADLLLKELPIESKELNSIRLYRILKGHHYFIAWLLLSRQVQ